MRKKLTRIGTSVAVVLDRPLLRRLGVDEQMEVDVDVLGHSLVITPVRSFEDDWTAALASRLQQVWLRVASDATTLASPDVVAECENLQRLVSYHLEGANLPNSSDPRAVANDETFRPGRTCARSTVEQFIGRGLSALRHLRASEVSRDASPKNRSGMTRKPFMDWAEALLIRKLGVSTVRREGDNNVQDELHADIHIGIVATIRATETHPGPCIRVQVWTDDAARAARWKGRATIAGPYPNGLELKYRRGDKGKRHYLEFSWGNDDLESFQRWLEVTAECVDFFVSARGTGGIP